MWLLNADKLTLAHQYADAEATPNPQQSTKTVKWVQMRLCTMPHIDLPELVPSGCVVASDAS